MYNWVTFALLMSVNIASIQSECNQPIRFYDNKLCDAILSGDPRNDCPKRFDCYAIDPNAPEQCFYAGGYYQAQEQVDYSMAPSCQTSRCRCQPDTRDFKCLAPECKNPQLPDCNDCYYTYNLEQCCATGYNCISNSSNTFRCNVEGTYYYEGQLFEPPNKKLCKQCVCNRNFQGGYDDTVCVAKPCPIELYHSSEVMNFCAPVYYDKDDCCPMDFYCPTPSDEKSMKMFTPKYADCSDMYCRWGEYIKIAMGTKMSRSSTVNGVKTSIQCECVIPPYLTCYNIC